MLLVLIFLQFSAVESCIYCCNCGALLPRDPKVTVGGTLELQCVLNDSASDLNSSHLYFAYQRDIPLPSENLRVVNSRTVKLIQHNITTGDEGTYSCNIHGRSGPGAVVESQYVGVVYPIQNVTNFSCVVHDWDEKLTCTWDLGKYNDNSKINVSLLGCNNIDKVNRRCRSWPPSHYLNTTFGSWIKQLAVIDTTEWLFYMKITDESTGSMNTQQFFYKTRDLVKPYPPATLTFSVVTSREIKVDWTNNRYHRPQVFKISYRSERGNGSVINLTECHTSDCSEALENLTPFTRYQVEIRSRPVSNGNQTGLWSDPVIGNVMTTEDVPSEAPKLVSYEVQQCQIGEFSRSITLYWSDIAVEKRNGIITNYQVRVFYEHRRVNQSYNSTTENGTLIFNAIVRVPCSEGAVIAIRVGTRLGLSRESEPLYVPPVTSGLFPPDIVVEASNIQPYTASLDVYWTRIPQAESYLLVYCINRCQKEEIQTREIANNVTSTSLKEVDRNVRIGLVAYVDKKNSGFKFKHCFYSKAKVPLKPQSVSVSPVKDSIQVQWMVGNCDQNYGYPASFRIEWCKITGKTCQGDWTHDVIPAVEPLTYFIPNLEYDYDYGVRVTSLTRTYGGQNGTDGPVESEPSAVVSVFLKESGLQTGVLVAITAACLFVFVLTVALACFIVRYLRRHVKEVLADTEVDVPKISHTGQFTDSGSSYGRSTSSEDYSYPTSPSVDNSALDPLLKYRRSVSSSDNPKFSNQISQDSGRGSLQSDQCAFSPVEQKPVPELPLSSVFRDSDYSKFGVQDRNPSSDSKNYKSMASSSLSDAYTSVGEMDSSSADVDSSCFPPTSRGHLEPVREVDTDDEHCLSSSDVSSYAKFGVKPSSFCDDQKAQQSSRNPETGKACDDVKLADSHLGEKSILPNDIKSASLQDNCVPYEVIIPTFTMLETQGQHKDQTVSFGNVTVYEGEKSETPANIPQAKDACTAYISEEAAVMKNTVPNQSEVSNSMNTSQNSAADRNSCYDSSSCTNFSTSATFSGNYVDVNCSSGWISDASSSYQSSSGY